MADFLPAYEQTLGFEGGYKHTSVVNDRGSETYAGLSRKANPHWSGWKFLDAGSEPPAELVREAYRAGYWDTIRGDDIKDQNIANNLYDFAVNAGVTTAVRLAQGVVGTTQDGKIGTKTLHALNTFPSLIFVLMYYVARTKRYEQIVSKDRTQGKFLLGWLRRSLRILEASK